MNDTITLLTGFINDRMKQKLSDSNIKLIITDLVTCIDILLNRLSNVENSMNDLSTLHNKHIAKYDKNELNANGTPKWFDGTLDAYNYIQSIINRPHKKEETGTQQCLREHPEPENKLKVHCFTKNKRKVHCFTKNKRKVHCFTKNKRKVHCFTTGNHDKWCNIIDEEKWLKAHPEENNKFLKNGEQRIRGIGKIDNVIKSSDFLD